MADLTTTASFDDSVVDVGLARMNRQFKAAGDRIERSTEGARKFAGALSSTAGVVTGVLGVVGLVAGAVTAVVSIVGNWRREQERVREAVASTHDRITDIRADTARLGQEAKLFASQEEAVRDRLKEIADLRRQSNVTIAEKNALVDEEFALLDQLKRIEDLRTEAAIEAADAERKRAAGVAFEREQQFIRQREEIRLIEEREAAEQRAADAARERAAIDADRLRRAIEIDRLRALGRDEEADALRREAELLDRIRRIEESEGFSERDRRELIDKARQTAEAEERAARERRLASQAESTGPIPIDQPQLSAVSLAAGLGGSERLAAQVFGGNRSSAEIEAVALQRRQNAILLQIKQTIDDAVNAPRQVA